MTEASAPLSADALERPQARLLLVLPHEDRVCWPRLLALGLVSNALKRMRLLLPVTGGGSSHILAAIIL